MKLAALLTVSCLFSASLLAAPKPSLISAYKGGYTGTSTLSSGGTVLAGTATATFQANKKKESGRLVITGIFSSTGSSLVVTHTINLSKHAYSQVIALLGSALVSSGSANIKAKAITFSGSGNATGTVFGETGLIKLTKNGLLVTDTISGGGEVDTFSYVLRSKKKK